MCVLKEFYIHSYLSIFHLFAIILLFHKCSLHTRFIFNFSNGKMIVKTFHLLLIGIIYIAFIYLLSINGIWFRANNYSHGPQSQYCMNVAHFLNFLLFFNTLADTSKVYVITPKILLSSLLFSCIHFWGAV